MSEDRTQAPSRRRLQQARERGQAAHSPELTGAAGLLAAGVALWAWGDALTAALLALVRAPLLGAVPVTADATQLVARLRELAAGVAWPLLLVVGAFAAAALAMHQAQVLGLWAPALLAPDLTRLWKPSQGPDMLARGTGGLWTLVKTAIIAVVAAWVIYADWATLQRLGALDASSLTIATAAALRHLVLTLAAATLGLGLLDLALQHQRFQVMLRLTPEEQREDFRSTEGDPALRARRRRLAQTWRGDSPELVAGASLVLTGPLGLGVVLTGGPPPRRVFVQSVVSGTAGNRLRYIANRTGLASVSAPDLARRLARRRPPTLPFSAELVAELAALWPVACDPKHQSMAVDER
jgi:flagellar biosynthetic protein FlhB